MATTFLGRGRADAIKTVDAPMDRPDKITGVLGDNLLFAYWIQERQSFLSRMPKVIVCPPLLA